MIIKSTYYVKYDNKQTTRLIGEIERALDIKMKDTTIRNISGEREEDFHFTVQEGGEGGDRRERE